MSDTATVASAPVPKSDEPTSPPPSPERLRERTDADRKAMLAQSAWVVMWYLNRHQHEVNSKVYLEFWQEGPHAHPALLAGKRAQVMIREASSQTWELLDDEV
jgi:hypothetical protein